MSIQCAARLDARTRFAARATSPTRRQLTEGEETVRLQLAAGTL